MSLLDDVRAAGASRPTCRIAHLLEELGDDLADELRDVLAVPIHEAGHLAIARALNARGYDVTERVIARHRKGECACR